MDCNLKQVAERALENILWELGRDLSKDAVLMEFDKDIKDFGITADPTMIKEAFKILMQNSIQVAKERLEDENEDRKSRHLESLTLKDRPIQLKIFLTRDKGGAVSLQVIEMSDNVGGISDPLLLEETRPGNGRQRSESVV